MSQSSIEWTTETWNPTTGCTKVSSGCVNCYAEVMARRLQAMGTKGYENGFNITLHPNRLHQPLKKKKPTTYFVNSMSDVFHPQVPFGFIDEVFNVIRQTPQHTYQMLTKRPKTMLKYFSKERQVPKNAWLGTSVENKKQGVPRIEVLRQIPCQTRFLSCEPLLEDLGEMDLAGIHWIIVGGESGLKARPMLATWAENIQKECQKQQVPFFFKQWGSWGSDGIKRSKKENGRTLGDQKWEEYPKPIYLKENLSLL